MAYADTILDVTLETGKQRSLRGYKITDVLEVTSEISEILYAKGPGSLVTASIDQVIPVRIRMPYREAFEAWQRALRAWEFDS